MQIETVKVTISEISFSENRKTIYRSRIDFSSLGSSKGDGFNFNFEEIDKIDYPTKLKLITEEERKGKSTFKKIESLGKKLYDKAFGGKVGIKLNEIRAKYATSETIIRIAFAVLPKELVQVPWEYIHDGRSFLLKEHNVHIIRIIDELPPRIAPFQQFTEPLLISSIPKSQEHIQNLKNRFEKIGLKKENIITLIQPDESQLRNTINEKKPDFIYFIGHGRLNKDAEGEVQLILKKGRPKWIPASRFAKWLSNSKTKFVYLNSCTTAISNPYNSFSGVAQRLLLNGNVSAVISMQAPILTKKAQNFANIFFEQIAKTITPESALSNARNNVDGVSWGIPVIYTYLRGGENFDKNNLATFLDANPSSSKFSIILPTFVKTIPSDDFNNYDKVEVNVLKNGKKIKVYNYPGKTYAATDVLAARYLFELIAQFSEINNDKVIVGGIDYLTSGSSDSDITHEFLIGSKSNDLVPMYLKDYNATFRFKFSEEYWKLFDTKYKRVYSVTPPNMVKPGTMYTKEDYGIIEKIVATDYFGEKGKGKIIFILAGFGDRATQGCCWYLLNKWRNISKKFITGSFQIILRFPRGNFKNANPIMGTKRKENKYSVEYEDDNSSYH